MVSITKEFSSSESSSEISIVFGGRSALNIKIPTNTVLIVPSDAGWNDFGHHARVDVRIRLEEDQTEYVTAAFIGFVLEEVDAPNGVVPLDNLFKTTGSLINLSSAGFKKFFTMLPNMEAYRGIVRKFGATRAVETLSAMHDLVALQEFKANVEWSSKALESDIFLKAFVRTSESFYAFKNAAPILRGLEFEEFHKLSHSFGIQFQLTGRKLPHVLSFSFEPDADLPKRIAVLIGKNGVGKSQTLGRIAKSALEGRDEFFDAKSGGRVLLNRILAFAPTNEAGSTFPSERRKRPRVWYKRFTLNRTGSIRNGGGASDYVLQVARSEEFIGSNSRWEIFLEAVKAIENSNQICLPVKNLESMPVALVDLARGGEQKKLEKFASIEITKDPVRIVSGQSYRLSSGEISFLRFAAQACLNVENGSLLLLDEPETHLHPNFISKFVSLLDSLLEQTGSIAIIATHSVYFVREVFRDQVTVLRENGDDGITSERPMLQTFGADIGAISYFVFGEDAPSQLASAVRKNLSIKFNSWSDLYKRYKDELSLEMLGVLRESMEMREKDE